MSVVEFDLQKHLLQEHRLNKFAEYIREIVYGGTDGIVTTFAVVAGFAGANADATTIPLLAVVIFGLANLFADGVSMALGSFLSTRAEIDLYKNEEAKERREVDHHVEIEKTESIQILVHRGFTHEQAVKLVEIYATNKPFWMDFMMNYELGLTDQSGSNPAIMACVTFVSFVVFGSIPLSPYLIIHNNRSLFLLSCISTFVALFFLGVLRYRVTRQSLARSITETLLVGGMAAIVAYLVGLFFRI